MLIPVTLLANGVGYAKEPTEEGAGTHMPLVAQTGCSINLDGWYIFLTILVCFKLLIEIFRYICVKINY